MIGYRCWIVTKMNCDCLFMFRAGGHKVRCNYMGYLINLN